MTPYIEKYDGIVKALNEKFEAGEELSEEMVNQLKEAYDDIAKYADIVPEELANVFYADDEMVAKMFPQPEE